MGGEEICWLERIIGSNIVPIHFNVYWNEWMKSFWEWDMDMFLNWGEGASGEEELKSTWQREEEWVGCPCWDRKTLHDTQLERLALEAFLFKSYFIIWKLYMHIVKKKLKYYKK